MESIELKNIEKKQIIQEIKHSKIFIYPTDTIYGLGCNAEDIDAVNKVKEIKQRDKDKPLSVIAPSIKWIKDNFIIDTDLSKYLPGPYTIILKKKDKDFLSHVSNTDSIGIRIPKSEFTKIIQKAGLPFITTSVNLAGEQFITSIDEVSDKIKSKVDYMIDAGILNGKPSTLIINNKEVNRKQNI